MRRRQTRRATAEDRLAVAMLLVKHGTYLDARDSYDKTPLYLAVQNGRADVVHYLLKKGANPNVRDEKWGKTPFHIAAYYGEITIAKLLIKYGANANARDASGRTPLHIAVEERNTDVIKALLRYGGTD